MCLAICLPPAARGQPQQAHGAVPRWGSRDTALFDVPESCGARCQTIALAYQAHRWIARAKTLHRGWVPPRPARPRARDQRRDAHVCSSGVQVGYSTPPRRAPPRAARGGGSPRTSDLVGGRGATPPEGRSPQGCPGSAWGRAQRLAGATWKFTTIVVSCCEIHSKQQ